MKKKGIPVPHKTNRLVDYARVACINAIWLVAPIIGQPRLHCRWAIIAWIIGVPTLVSGAVIAWSAIRERRITGIAELAHLVKNPLVPSFGKEYESYREKTPAFLPWFLTLPIAGAYVFDLISPARGQPR